MIRPASAARLAIVAIAALLGACAGTPAPAPPPMWSLAPELRSFLPDPVIIDATSQGVSALHARLLLGHDPSTLLAQLDEAFPPPRRPAGADLLAAEIALVDGSPALARRQLEALDVEMQGQPAVLLFAGRVAEEDGDRIAAVEAYRRAAASFPAAAERVSELEPAAVEDLRAALDERLAERRAGPAVDLLAILERWRPDEPETWSRQVAVAELTADAPRELAARRALAGTVEESLDQTLRRGYLEVEVGNSGSGLALLEQLIADHPDNPEVRSTAASARFLFRLVNSPEPVRRLVGVKVLSRSDLARLLYWLVPGLRSARVQQASIATDILNHAAREEIVRIASLGLMAINESLHLFDPERALSRREVFRALLLLPTARAAGELPAEEPGERRLCAGAVHRGWIPEPAECLPAATVSGREAIDWIRSTVDSGRDPA